MIVRGNDTLTVPGATRIADLARDGLPIIFSGGVPSYLASYNASGAEYVNKTLEDIRDLKNVHEVPYDNLAESIASLGIEPLTKVTADATWYTYWRINTAKSEDYVFVYNDSPTGIPEEAEYSEGTVEFRSIGKPYLLDPWSGTETPILNYTQTETTTTIFFRFATNQDAIVAFKNKEQSTRHAVATSPNVVAITGSCSALAAHVIYTTDNATSHVETSDGNKHSVKATSKKAFEIENWILTVEHWDPPDDLSDIDTVAVKHNTTHELSSITSWQNIDGLQGVSGRGYYAANLTWSPSDDVSGAIISFGPIMHTIRVIINGQTIPTLDTTSAKADITKYLVEGTNKVEVIVATTLSNVLAPIWDQLRVSGVAPTGLDGSSGQPSGDTDYGLLYPVVVTPYLSVKL